MKSTIPALLCLLLVACGPASTSMEPDAGIDSAGDDAGPEEYSCCEGELVTMCTCPRPGVCAGWHAVVCPGGQCVLSVCGMGGPACVDAGDICAVDGGTGP